MSICISLHTLLSGDSVFFKIVFFLAAAPSQKAKCVAGLEAEGPRFCICSGRELARRSPWPWTSFQFWTEKTCLSA